MNEARTEAQQNEPNGASEHRTVQTSHLLRAIRNSNVVLLCQDGDGRYEWGENMPPRWSERPVRGLTDRDLYAADAADRIGAGRIEASKGTAPARFEVSLPSSPYDCWYEVWIDVERDGDGRPLHYLTTLVDISERKRREQTLRTLLREVSHRSKNLLAIIQSIANQTARHATGLSDFLTRFAGRIQSIAMSQDLVTSSNWHGALLSGLVRDQVGRYVAERSKSVDFRGSDLYLTPNAALHVGLGLHELAVNSVSGGALASPDGRVTIEATALGDPDKGSARVLTWSEKVSSAILVTEGRFSSTTLERVVPTALNASADLSVENGILRYRLTLPPDSFHVLEPEAGAAS